jgi:hypothetical protein
MSEVKSYNPEISDLNKNSESLTDKLENIESKLWLTNNEDLLSDDVRSSFLVIKNQNRTSENQELNQEYSSLLKKYNELWERNYTSKEEYLNAWTELLKDLWNLEIDWWEKLKNIEIDWEFIETISAIAEWTQKAINKIKEELEETVKLLLSPEEWDEVLKSIWDLLLNPTETIKTIISSVSEELNDISRDINLIKEKSTKTWYYIEMSEYIPAIAIPAFIETIWPWKFLKILEIKPEIVSKIENKYNWKLWLEDNTVELNSKLNDNDRLNKAEELLGKKLNKEQKELIIKAHEKWEWWIWNYSNNELKEKSKILKEAGLSNEERRILMENWITGKEIELKVISIEDLNTNNITEIRGIINSFWDDILLNPNNIKVINNKLDYLIDKAPIDWGKERYIEFKKEIKNNIENKIKAEFIENDQLFNSAWERIKNPKEKKSYNIAKKTIDDYWINKPTNNPNYNRKIDIKKEQEKIIENFNLKNINNIIRDHSFFEKITLTHKEIVDINILEEISDIHKNKLSETLWLCDFTLDNYNKLSINQKTVLKVYLSQIVKNSYIITEKIWFKNKNWSQLIKNTQHILNDENFNKLIVKLWIDWSVTKKLTEIRDKRKLKAS